MASLKRRLEGEIDIRVAGGEAFHEILVNKPHHVSNISPHIVQGCDLHEGDFGKPGTKISWTYTLDGKTDLTLKQIIEVIDEENKVIKFNCIEGDLLNDYKTYALTCQVIPKGKETSTVKWIIEYEKMHKDIPEPTSFMDALMDLAKDLDDYHHPQG